MVTITTFSVYGLFSITFFISLLCLTISTAVRNPKQGGLAIELIHRNSPISPLYNPDITFGDKAEVIYESSIARYADIISKRSEISRTEINPYYYIHLAKLHIGSPPFEVFTVVDTGSHLLWIQCEPCVNCQDQKVPIFDRTKSSSYVNITCDDTPCTLVPNKGCDQSHDPVCTYKITYADGVSYSSGFVARELISFINANGVIVNNIRAVFGCGIDNKEYVRGKVGGVLGLAANYLSVASQLSTDVTKPKFSYCLSNGSDPNSKGNVIIGDDAHINGFTTPFKFDRFYRVDIYNIKFGSQSIGASVENVIIDSGTVYSFVPPEVYDKIKGHVSNTIQTFFRVAPTTPPKEGMSCYAGNIGRDLNGFPTMTIIFEGGLANLELDRWNLFVQDDDAKFCLAFISTAGYQPARPSVLGSMAQQFYNMGFDFHTNGLSIIKVADCRV